MDKDGSRSFTLKLKSNSKDHYSFLEGIKQEWQLFWHTIVDEFSDSNSEAKSSDLLNSNVASQLNSEKIRTLSRTLSADRRKINQRLEKIQKEIELNQAKLESLQISGQSTDAVNQRINELHELGGLMSQELQVVDARIKKTREIENRWQSEEA